MHSSWRRMDWRIAMAVLAASLGASAATTRPDRPGDQLSEAQSLLRTGSYEEAVTRLEQLAGDPQLRVSAAVGIAEAWRQVGRYDDALSRLNVVEQEGEASDAWQLARAEVLNEVGRYREAIAAAQRAVEMNSKNTTARRLLGELYETVGERDKAIVTYAWFESLLRQGYPASAGALTDAGIAIYRQAVLKRSRDTTMRTKYVLHDLFQPACERVDRKWWPAYLASADLLLTKYNLEQARGDYKSALKINSHLAVAHVGLGLAALAEWKFEDVAKEIEAALKINPRSAEAYCLQARLHLTQRKEGEAAKDAEKALATNPASVEALALLASARLLMNDEAGMKSAVERADKVNGRSAVVPNELATWLSSRNQFAEAEAQFKRAMELAPEWADPRTGLGMLYMEMGDERSARQVLDASWKLDPFNEKTFHTLNLLDELEKFGRDETEHFVIESGEGPDAVIRPLIAAFAEGIYANICKEFNYEPKSKTIIEVFPEHRGFAVRITGRPFLHTVGATTGPVIAMDAPRTGPTSHTFNWARVVRHEFTHTVTMAATDYRIPHWLTEGLAVRAEGNPRPWEWCLQLSMALRRGRLFNLDTVDWGFARPQRSGDWTLAYAQSQWMVEYLVEKYGPEVINRLLAGFKDKGGQAEVFAKVLKRSPGEFIGDFTAWARVQAEKWPLPKTPIPPIKEIEKKLPVAGAAEKPGLLMALAEARLDDGDRDGAAKAIREAVDLDDHNARVLAVMTRVLTAQAAGSRDKKAATTFREEAVEQAEKLAKIEPANPDAAMVLAVAALEAKDDDRAIECFARVSKTWPMAAHPREHLAHLYMKKGQRDKALGELTELARMQPNEEDYPIRIAKIHADEGRPEEAVRWYREALKTAPYSVDIYNALGQLLMREQRFPEAVETYRTLTKLQPAKAAGHSRLAFALHAAGKTEEAKIAARRAVNLDPKSEAQSLLKD
jgi:cellulose synthase operon protein C